MLLGCVADDLTGATDLAATFVREGMRAVLLVGDAGEVTSAGGMHDVEAVVVALKTRTAPVAEAVAQSVAAVRALEARQWYFKYCSTFDSTDEGNIGPVADALADELGASIVPVCPAFPANGRTVYNGYLFVDGVLLSESGMRDHPLTPMTDPSLVRVLGRQTPHRVGRVDLATVRLGAEAVASALRGLGGDGFRYAVVDAVDDGDLRALGAACADLPLVTGGSGAAIGLPAALGVPVRPVDELPVVEGPAVVIAGSCSAATRAQVDAFGTIWPTFRLDPLVEDSADRALEWALPRLGELPLLVASTAEPREVTRVQAELGARLSAERVEGALARVAAGLVQAGARRLVVAGGETAGAVVAALGLRSLRVGREIAPGVPWTVSTGEPPLALALKSGNFGDHMFFAQALYG